MTGIHIINNHPTLKLRLRDDGWCENASLKPGDGPRFRNTASVRVFGGTFGGGNFWGGTFRGGTFRGGTFEGGDFWGGTFGGGTFEGGTFWGGTFWGGDFRGGDFWGGTFGGGNFWGGDFRGGTFEGGDFRGGTFRGGTFTFALTAQRSDGYVFTVNDDGLRLAAGCRYFTFAEAREHWARTRAGTQLGDESFAILDHLERMVAIRYPTNQETTT